MMRLEYMKVRGGIRFILKLYFPVRVGEEDHLTRCLDPATVELMSLQHILGVEVAKTAAAPMQCVVPREVGH